MTEQDAIAIAEKAIADAGPNPTPAFEVVVCWISIEDQRQQQIDDIRFLRLQGAANEIPFEPQQTEGYWEVAFYRIPEPGSYSTAPPAIVHVSDDGKEVTIL